MNMQRLTSSATGLLVGAIVFMTVYAWAILHAETQTEVISLFVAAAVAALAVRRLRLVDPLRDAAAAAPKLLGAGCVAGALVLLVAFHDVHFALLLLSTVLLYSVVGLGLNIQFGYCGIVNFAGAAFFGVGSYTAAVLSTHSPLPHLLILVIGGLMAALIGSLLILPVLRTRGHYAALVTIAFGILFKNFLEVNDTLGGPQGLKIPGMKIFGWVLSDNIDIGSFEISLSLIHI